MAYLLAVIFLSLVGAGLTCLSDGLPVFENELGIGQSRIDWYCTSNMTNYTCLTYVIDEANDTIQVNPPPVDVDLVGRINYFDSDYNGVSLYFRPEANIVRSGKQYTFKVQCSDGTDTEQFNRSVVPQYRNLDRPAEMLVRLVDNAPYVSAGIIVLVFIFIFLVIIVAVAR